MVKPVLKKTLLPYLALFAILAFGDGCSRGKLINPKKGNDAPQINQIIPSSGLFSGGTDVAIIGSGFVNDTAITFGDLNCAKIKFVSSTTLICTTPPYPKPAQVDIKLTNPNKLTALLKKAFLFTDAVSNVAGASITGGSSIATSSSFHTDYHVNFSGTSNSLGAQSSQSFSNVPGAMAIKFKPLLDTSH